MCRVFIFLTFLILSCNYDCNKLKRKKSYYNDGSLKEIKYFNKNNNLRMIKKFYPSDSSLRAIIIVRDSVRHLTQFTSDSVLMGIGRSVNGKKDGLFLIYYSNGQLAQKINFDKGKINGKKYIYSKKGKLDKIKIYDQGKLLEVHEQENND